MIQRKAVSAVHAGFDDGRQSDSRFRRASEPPAQRVSGDRTSKRGKRLSESLLWRFQKTFFDALGDRAWTDGIVPHYITGNGWIADAYAKVVLGWLRDHGYRSIQFNAVVSTNTAAIRLWQSLGFEIVGTVPEAFLLPSGEYADMHVMHLRMKDSRP